MKVPPIVKKWINKQFGLQSLLDENKKLRNALEIQKKEFEEERMHKIKTSGGGVVREPELLYITWKCFCGKELVGIFPRKEGFDFTCKCGNNFIGAVSEFEQKTKEAFLRLQAKMNKLSSPEMMAVSAYLAVIDTVILTPSEQDMVRNILIELFSSECVVAE